MLPSPDCRLEYWLTPLPSDARPSVNACLLTGVADEVPPLANACVSVCDSDCCVLPTCDSVSTEGMPPLSNPAACCAWPAALPSPIADARLDCPFSTCWLAPT